MAVIINDVPSGNALVDEKKMGTGPFVSWLKGVFLICFAAQQSGTTANRPTKNLWLGRRYYDTSLNKPVYVNSVNPVVWKDAAGTTV